MNTGMNPAPYQLVISPMDMRRLWYMQQQSQKAQKERITLGEAITRTLAAKKLANRRKRYLDNLKFFLNFFAKGREQIALDSISPEAIEKWLAEKKYTANTMRGCLGRLGSLFGYATRRGWIQHNPMTRIDRPTMEQRAPKILTVEESETLLRKCKLEAPRALAFLTLALFAGVRPEEFRGISWENVREEYAYIEINAEFSKVRSRRIVTLEPNASAWLKYAHSIGSLLPVTIHQKGNFVRTFKRLLKMERWHADILRHTAASFLLAKHQNPGTVSFWLGNSPGILLTHYKSLVTREQAEKFFSILP